MDVSSDLFLGTKLFHKTHLTPFFSKKFVKNDAYKRFRSLKYFLLLELNRFTLHLLSWSNFQANTEKSNFDGLLILLSWAIRSNKNTSGYLTE